MSKMHVDENSAEIPSDALEPGTDLLHGQYTIESFLNAGGFGITYLARDGLERIVVIKECFPSTMCCRTHNVARAQPGESGRIQLGSFAFWSGSPQAVETHAPSHRGHSPGL